MTVTLTYYISMSIVEIGLAHLDTQCKKCMSYVSHRNHIKLDPTIMPFKNHSTPNIWAWSVQQAANFAESSYCILLLGVEDPV